MDEFPFAVGKSSGCRACLVLFLVEILNVTR